MRAVFYGRKSNDDRGEIGESIEQQREWAAGLDVTIVKEFSDQSISGNDTAKRSGFAQMVAFCQEQARLKNPIEVVVCWKANRFSRADSLETSAFLHNLRSVGTSLMLTSEKWIDFNKATDRLIFGIQQEASEHAYLTNCSTDTRRGKSRAAREGKFNGGKPPYGYRKVGTKLEVHPEEAAHVRFLFETYATKDISVRGLVEELRLKGVRSPNRTKECPEGKPLWVAQTITELLRNPLYLGNLVFGRANYSKYVGAVKLSTRKPDSGQPKPESDWITVRDAHPALVDRDTFDQVQLRLTRNKQRKSPRKTAPYVLSGLLVCGKCGHRMIAKTDQVKWGGSVHRYRQYTCYNYHMNGIVSGCARNMVDDEKMVRSLAKKISQWYSGSIDALRAELQRETTVPSENFEACFASLNKRINKLVERLEDDLPDEVLADVRDRIRALSDERNEVRSKMAKVISTEPSEDRVEKLLAMVSRLDQAIKHADSAMVSELFRGLLDRVEVFFTTKAEKNRTRATFSRALLYQSSNLSPVSPGG